MAEMVSFKWVRRGDRAHCGLYGDTNTFCGLPLSKYQNARITLGELHWCEKCRRQALERYTVTVP